MNWGGFADGFSRGFNNGMAIGKNVTDAMKQKKIEDVRAQGIAEAQAAQSKAIADLVKDNGVAPPLTPQQSQTVPVAPVEKIETRPLEPVGTGATPGQPAGVTPTAPDAAVTPASPSAVTPSAVAQTPSARAQDERVLGYKVRAPFQGEDKYFKENPKVSGMAAEDGSIVLNPYSGLSSQEKSAVAKNEAYRLLMRDKNIVPSFELTDQQRNFFAGTPYEKNEVAMKQTIVARILSGDPSAIATPSQIQEANEIASAARGGQAQNTPSLTPTPAIPVPESEKSLVTPTAPIVVPADAAAGGLPGKKRFSVGDASFDTREEAEAHAKKSAPSVMDFMAKTLVPKMTEAYVAQGDMEKAAAWEKWAEDRQSKVAMREWAQAWRAASTGNIEKAADHVFNLYKTFDDGVTPMSKEIVKDKQGNVTGFNVRLKNDATGEERTQFIDKGALTEMGLSALSPPQMFEQAYKRKAEADKAAAEMRIKEAEEARAEGREIRKEVRGDVRKQAEEVRAEARDVRKGDREQENAIEKLTIEGQIKAASKSDEEKAKVKSKVDLLRQAGFTDDRINDMMPAIIGIGEFKKGTSPEEARRMIVTELIKDRNFNRKPQADKDKIIDDSMRMIYGRIPPKEAADAASAAANGLPAATPAPATPAAPADRRTSTGTIGGAPAAAATQTPAARPKGVPVFDTKTGTIIYR